VRSVRGMPGVAQAANVTYFTMQVQGAPDGDDTRAMVVGIESGQPGEPGYLVAGRQITRSHYEAVADVKTGFALGERIRIRRHDYTVVGLTRRMVSSGGDPMVFVALKDAQEAQFLKDNDAIVRTTAPARRQPRLQPPRRAGPAGCGAGLQTSSHSVNAVLVQLAPALDAEQVAEPIRRWKHLQVFTRAGMEDILVAKLIATRPNRLACSW
jgi:putative ABC transport system permease protein